MKKLYILILLISVTTFAQRKISLLEQALEKYAGKHYAETIELLTQLEQEKNSDEVKAEINYYKAKSFVEMNNFSEAVYYFEKLIDEYKGSSLVPFALFDLGKFYYERKYYKEALNDFKQLIDNYPYHRLYGSALFWAGESATKLGLFDQAVEYYSDAISMSFTNKYYVESIYSLANLYFENKDYDDAIAYYDELLSYHSSSSLAPFSQLKIGEAYYYAEEYDNAILELTDPKIKKLNQQRQLEAQYYIANSYFRMKEYDKALKIYEDLLKTFPDEEQTNEIRFNQAWINFQSGMYDEAYRIFNFLSKFATGRIAEESLYWAGESKRYAGENEIAKLIYKRFMKLYPGSELYGLANFNLGLLIYDEGNIAEAEKFLVRALNKVKGKALGKALVLLGEIYLEQGKNEKALEMFNEALSQKASEPKVIKGAKLGIGVANFYLGNFSTARKILTELFLLDKNFERNKVNYFLAESHFNLGDYYSALEHYKLIGENDSKFSELALFGKAYCYFNLKNYADAAYFFGEFTRKYPDSKFLIEAKQRWADSYYGTKNFAKALEIYEYLYLGYPNKISAFAYYQYGKTLVNLKKNSDAIFVLNQLINKFPKSKYADDAYYLTGWINFKSGNYPKAIQIYKSLLKKYSKTDLRPVVYSSLVDAYYNTGDYTNAVFYYKRLLDNYPKTKYALDAINGIQYSYIAVGNPDKAARIIDEYMIRNPFSKFGEKILIKKGEIYYNAGKFDKAILAYKEFIATFPSSLQVPDAYYWIGKSAMNLNRTEQAQYYFEYVINEYPNSAAAISSVLELGKVYEKNCEYEKAINAYDKVYSSTEPTDKKAEILYRKGLDLIQLGKIKKVYETFNKLTTDYPQSIFATKGQLELATLELARGNYELAEKVFSEIGKERKDDIGAQAQYFAGETLFEQKKYSEAIAAYSRVVNIFSQYVEWKTKAELRIADCYTKLKNYFKAKKLYRDIYRKHRYDKFGFEAKRKLRKIR